MTESSKSADLFARIRQKKSSYLFVAPFLIFFFMFTVLPVIISIFYSFTSFNVLESPKFIWAENYLRLFLSDDIFMTSIKNTLIIAVVVGPVSYILSLMLAWLINDFSRRTRSIFTLIFYAPSISGNVYLIWMVLFSSDSHGYINGLLLKLGFIAQPVLWLKDERFMLMIIIIVSLWSSISTSFLSFIAGLQGVDRAQYEAAAIEGVKNRWQELWYVTLPSMKPQLMFGAVMSITASFGVGAVVTALCGFPSTNYAAHTIMNHLEDYGGIRYEMGYASAIAVLLFVLMVGSNMVIRRMISKVGK